MVFQRNVQMGGSAWWQRGVGAAVSMAILTVSGAAMAAPMPSSSLLLAQVPPGDVVVPTTPDGSTGGSTGGVLTGTRFTCQLSGSQYTVMYNPESQPGQMYPWAVPGRMGGGWSPDRRCGEIARRLEAYRPDGLVEMRTQVENGLNTICVTTQNTPSCRIVLTVPQGQDPLVTRDRVFENLTIADSGQQTQGVNTLIGNGQDRLVGQLGALLKINGGLTGLSGVTAARPATGLNLRPFLDRKDGGTGERLSSASSRRTPRVKPRIFR
jgi:Circadian oscillating protein COP23